MSGNERALLRLKENVAQMLKSVEVVHRTCPVGDHAANGSIEVAVLELKRKMRCFRLARRELQCRPDNDHVLLLWIAPVSAHVISYRRDASGKTAFEKEFGRK